jgi:catechol 2,3-dioxygenase-like lactoylglutathione lyase family enzyme
MEDSIEFYRDALALTLFQDEIISGPEVDEGLMEKDAKVRMVILLDEKGNMIELLGWQSPQARKKPPEHNRFTSIGIVEVCLIVSDLEEAEKRLLEKGYSFRNPIWTFGEDIESYGGGYAKIRYVEDPNGIQVELMEIVAPPSSDEP